MGNFHHLSRSLSLVLFLLISTAAPSSAAMMAMDAGERLGQMGKQSGLGFAPRSPPGFKTPPSSFRNVGEFRSSSSTGSEQIYRKNVEESRNPSLPSGTQWDFLYRPFVPLHEDGGNQFLPQADLQAPLSERVRPNTYIPAERVGTGAYIPDKKVGTAAYIPDKKVGTSTYTPEITFRPRREIKLAEYFPQTDERPQFHATDPKTHPPSRALGPAKTDPQYNYNPRFANDLKTYRVQHFPEHNKAPPVNFANRETHTYQVSPELRGSTGTSSSPEAFHLNQHPEKFGVEYQGFQNPHLINLGYDQHSVKNQELIDQLIHQQELENLQSGHQPVYFPQHSNHAQAQHLPYNQQSVSGPRYESTPSYQYTGVYAPHDMSSMVLPDFYNQGTTTSPLEGRVFINQNREPIPPEVALDFFDKGPNPFSSNDRLQAPTRSELKAESLSDEASLKQLNHRISNRGPQVKSVPHSTWMVKPKLQAKTQSELETNNFSDRVNQDQLNKRIPNRKPQIESVPHQNWKYKPKLRTQTQSDLESKSFSDGTNQEQLNRRISSRRRPQFEFVPQKDLTHTFHHLDQNQKVKLKNPIHHDQSDTQPGMDVGDDLPIPTTVKDVLGFEPWSQ